jgi:ribosome-associated protein
MAIQSSDMASMQIRPDLSIDENEIKEKFIFAAGPGGQNINKVATGVQLRFDVAGSQSLPEEVRRRLIGLAGKRVNSAGELIIESKAYRSQRRNRQEARRRLSELVSQALERPKTRKETRPTRDSRERRLAKKRQRSDIKQLRRRIAGPDFD